MKNPYKWRNKLPADSDMFFGRKREMDRLMDMLSGTRPQNVSLVGERRIGKSSLAFRVFHKLKETGDTLAIYLDCDELTKTCDSDNDFFQELNHGFKVALEGDTGLKERLGISEENLFTNYREFRGFVGRVSDRGVKLAIFLDEFEHLPNKAFADN